ncbi:MAG TPA: hypothetical protein VI756_10455 [Blastocatellia bacterium]
MKQGKFAERRLFVLNNPQAPRLCPELAAEIGLNDSILLLQFEFWTAVYGLEREGRLWVRKSVRDIHEDFPFWGHATVVRILASLEEQKLLVSSAAFNDRPDDKTKWYSINLDECAKLSSITIEGSKASKRVVQNGPASYQNGPPPSYQSGPGPLINLDRTSYQNGPDPVIKMDHPAVHFDKPLKEGDLNGEKKRDLSRELDDEERVRYAGRELLSGFVDVIAEAATQISGGKLPDTPTERERWNALGRQIASQLTDAAGRTEEVSSPPAFLEAHLSRKGKGRKGMQLAGRGLNQALSIIKSTTQLHTGEASYTQADFLDDLEHKFKRAGLPHSRAEIEELCRP